MQREAERVVDDLCKLEVDDSLCTGEAAHTRFQSTDAEPLS
jgi:hypothetical protein